jgi:hypothetical protein
MVIAYQLDFEDMFSFCCAIHFKGKEMIIEILGNKDTIIVMRKLCENSLQRNQNEQNHRL